MGSTSAFAQLTVEDNANDRTLGLNDGEESLTYNFPGPCDFKLMVEGKRILQQGTAETAELGVLAPGTYWMMYEREDGKAILDRFEIQKK